MFKAMLAGITPKKAVDVLSTALGGKTVSFLHNEDEVNAIPITLRLKEEDRSSLDDLKKVDSNRISIGLAPLDLQRKKDSLNNLEICTHLTEKNIHVVQV